MTFERNPQHAERGILKFAAPFWGKPRWGALFVAIARQIQELEDAAWDVLTKRMIGNATGAQLQVLAKLVGQVDPGLGDDVLRNLVRVRIRVNRSGGRRKDILAILNLLSVAKSDRTLINVYPAKMRLDLTGVAPLPVPLLHSTLSEAMSAGVGLILLHSEEPSFVFPDYQNLPHPRGRWANNFGSSGVAWASVAGP